MNNTRRITLYHIATNDSYSLAERYEAARELVRMREAAADRTIWVRTLLMLSWREKRRNEQTI